MSRCDPLGRRQRTRLFHAVGDARDAYDGLGTLRPNAGAVPVPRRDVPPGLGVGGDTHAGRRGAGGGLAVPAEERAPGAVRLGAGDLLLEDGGDQGLEHQPRTADAPAAARTPPGIPQHRLDRGEAVDVVVGAEHRRDRVEQPVGAWTPGGGVYGSGGRVGPQAEGARAGGGAYGSPDAAVGLDPVRGIAGAPVDGEGAVDVDRVRRLPLADLAGCVVGHSLRAEP